MPGLALAPEPTWGLQIAQAQYLTGISLFLQVFQGIGPSKVKAKVMAAELALMNRGALTEMTVKPDIVDANSPEDFTADCTETALFYDFIKPETETDEMISVEAGIVATETIASADDDVVNVDGENYFLIT